MGHRNLSFSEAGYADNCDLMEAEDVGTGLGEEASAAEVEAYQGLSAEELQSLEFEI